MKIHDCPQCGQDMRLPPNTWSQLQSLWKLARELQARIDALTKAGPQ